VSILADTAADLCLEEMAPDAFCSSLVDDCIARGKTIKEGGATYDIVSGLHSGATNVADAFMALKTRVFDEKALTAAQVMVPLGADFQNPGGELVRQRLLHSPKFGNDIAEVDGIAARILNDYLDESRHYHNTRHGRGPIGGGYAGSTSNISANVPLGASVGATPDGRRKGEPIAEGVSPVHGCDTGGPTKVLRSLSRLPTIKSIAQLLNLRLLPGSLETEEGLHRLVALLKGFRNLKLWHVQFNTVSTQALLDAQQQPEKYRDLVVRVDAQIRELRAMLNGGRTKSAAAEPPKRKRRRISAAGPKRIAEGQRKRWAETKQQSAPSLQTVTSEAPKRKRRLSAAGRKRIIEATKRRWALKRAELEQAQRASSKKGATGKVTAKRAA
jgi:hypothetical protein